MDAQMRIAEILQRRRTRLPAVQEAIKGWERLDQNISTLGSAVEELRAHPRTPSELRQALSTFSTVDLRGRAALALQLLHVLEGRFARDTVNIGVSGRARVGKSTLLQTLSGLSDGQIPTGSGLPVTAVRSRIVHSATQARATLTLHTFDSFRDEVIAPYHAELGLANLPANMEQFRTFAYPRSEQELAPEYRDRHSSITILRRLRNMQVSLPSYEGELRGGEKTIGLDELRPYVAYPTDAEMASGHCEHRYLAVRDVRIECAFPHAQVEHLGIVDLPGLGEVAANAEEHHLAGLKNDVDAVLLVKRPVEGMAYWTREDANTVNLLDRARGFVRLRRDFVSILINHGLEDATRVAALRNDIQRQANDGRDGAHFRVLEADVTDATAVHDNVLTALLEHLGERLPTMDEEIFQGTREACAAEAARIRQAVQGLTGSLSTHARAAVSGVEDVIQRSEELRKDLAAALESLVSALRRAARSSDEDPAFMDALERAYGDTRKWIESGFGMGKAAWCTAALRQMRVDRFSQGFAGHELNRIRVEISGRFCSMDDYFSTKVDGLWAQVSDLLKEHLGLLLEDHEGERALEHFARCLEEAAEPCPSLARAVRDLRSLRLDYRTQLHPRVRRALDGLNLQVPNQESGQPQVQLAVDVSESGAEQLYRALTQMAEQAAYETFKSLVAEALTPALVLHAALEQFEDMLIRSGNSQTEFRQLGRSCRDDIWPGVYVEAEQASARTGRTRQAVAAVNEQLNRIQWEAA